MPPRRRSRRLMSEKEAVAAKAEEERKASLKTLDERTRLQSIDDLIARLSPNQKRKTKKAINRLHSGHKARQRTIARAKEAKKQKAMATREFNKRTKSAKLNKENSKVARILVDNGFPLDVSLIIAKDRQDLLTRDKTIKKVRRDLEKVISAIPKQEETVKLIESRVDNLVSKGVPDGWISAPGHRRANSSGWLHINLVQERHRLQKEKDSLENMIKNVEDMKITLGEK